MITRVTGTIVRVLDEEVRLQVGAFEYQVLIPEFVRRQLQTKIGQETVLHTSQFLEGNQMSTRFVPRLIGFSTEADLEFFDLFCTVDKIGVRKALKALTRPVQDVAGAIHRQDTKWLTMLPGVGAATAESIVATLKKKVAAFTVASVGEGREPETPNSVVEDAVVEDTYKALLSVGHNPADARGKIDVAVKGGKTYKTVEEMLVAIYSARK